MSLALIQGFQACGCYAATNCCEIKDHHLAKLGHNERKSSSDKAHASASLRERTTVPSERSPVAGFAIADAAADTRCRLREDITSGNGAQHPLQHGERFVDLVLRDDERR